MKITISYTADEVRMIDELKKVIPPEHYEGSSFEAWLVRYIKGSVYDLFKEFDVE